MRILILGMGGVGSMAAWRLSAAGHTVIGIEQFQLDHDLGSSFGESRIVRSAYPDPFYTALMADSFALWDELSAAFPDQDLVRRTGGIVFAPRDDKELRASMMSLRGASIRFAMLGLVEVADRYPAFRLSSSEMALYDPTMGYARASRCVTAAVSLAKANGAEIREGCTAAGIECVGGEIVVTTRYRERIFADGLILSAGPWTAPIIASLDMPLSLTVTRQPYMHFEPTGHEKMLDANRFPVWIDLGASMYGLPLLGDVPGLKVASHERGDLTSAETVDRIVSPPERDALRAYAKERIPWVGTRTVCEQVCLYTSTPDNDFIVDRIRELPNSVVVAGLSGHGFKFVPLLGDIAAKMVTGQELAQDISRFRADRFDKPAPPA
jgi:monomeric sarcosine oxidase